MFRRLARKTGNPDALVQLHPAELMALMELAWSRQSNLGALGGPTHRSDLPGLFAAPPLPNNTSLPLAPWPTPASAPSGNGVAPSAAAPFAFAVLNPSITTNLDLLWDHLIYAYMIENTRIYEIFRRVLHEFLHGERLSAPTALTQLWLRNTEELFYRHGPSFSITTIDSHIRNDLRGTRRNAYQRMFGMELTHGSDDGQPYAYVKPDVGNTDFVNTLEEFLREVWVGMIHVSATAAPRPTDDAKIATLASRMFDMLLSRRRNGNLSREEFVFVSMMSWFHLAVDTQVPLPIIVDLKADISGAEQRLFTIAKRVGLPAHGLSKSYFEIAEPLSTILVQIENGDYNSAAAVAALYTPGSPVEPAMRTIITHWSIISGRDLKAAKVASPPTPPTPAAMPAPVLAASANGAVATMPR